MRKVQLLSVRPAPHGFDADVLGLVSFGFECSEFDGALSVTRYSKANDKEYTVAIVNGASAVRIDDAQLRTGKDDRSYLTIQNLAGVPRDVLDRIALDAHAQLIQQESAAMRPRAATPPPPPARPVAAVAPSAPAGPEDGDSIPF